MLKPRMSAKRYSKFKELILYMLCQDKRRRFTIEKISNLLYLVDMEYYKFTGKFLTGETYIKTDDGAMGRHVNKALEELWREGAVKIKVKQGGKR